jgi:hypothetical protein
MNWHVCEPTGLAEYLIDIKRNPADVAGYCFLAQLPPDQVSTGWLTAPEQKQP